MSANYFCTVSCQNENSDDALRDVIRQLEDDPNCSTPPTLVLIFVSMEHVAQLETIATQVSDALSTNSVYGCTGEAIVAGRKEIEAEACLAIWCAWLPQATIHPMHLTFDVAADGRHFTGWSDELVENWPTGMSLLVLGEPFSFPADVFLEQVNQDQPQTAMFGGMASGGSSPGESKLIYQGDVVGKGAVVLGITGTQIDTIVSQGCRPIGQPFVITKAEQNVIYELGGKSAVAQLKQIYEQLPNRDKELVQSGLQVGRVVNEYQDSFDHGDFLIRNVAGMSPEDESIVVGDYFRVGQTVQFHLRDAMTAHSDLRQMLNLGTDTEYGGALLFTCNGRGLRLFDEPDQDTSAIEEIHGDIPTAGFFCQGEIGSIGGINFLHGFTACVAIFGKGEGTRP